MFTQRTAKVFGIGFHKTGTKSLGAALSLLGYRVMAQFGTRDADIAATALARALDLAQQYDAFQDNPWPVLYKEMDTAFPGSKFILTVCPTDEWIERAARYFGTDETPMRQWIYGFGSPVGHEAVYAARYEAHNAEVEAHFKDRPGDLLVFPLTMAPSWRPLCRFLAKPEPADVDFPHVNKGVAGLGHQTANRT